MNPEPAVAKIVKHKFINRFSYSQKFIVICVLFAICLVTLSVGMIRQQNENVAVIEKELMGVAYLRPILSLLEYVIDHHQTSQRFLLGEKSLENVMAHLQQRVSESFSNLQEADAEYGSLIFERKVISDWKLGDLTSAILRTKWNELQDRLGGSSASESAALHLTLIEALDTLAAHLADDTVIPDDNVVSYYLGVCVFILNPDLQQKIVSAASLSERVIAAKEITEEQKDSLLILTGLIEEAMAQLTDSAFKAAQARKLQYEDVGLKAALEQPLAGLSASVANMLTFIKKNLLKAEAISGDASAFVVLVTRTLNESFQFPQVATEQLQTLLQERLRAYTHQRRETATTVSLLSLAAFSFAILLLRSMFTPMRKLVVAADELAKGHFKTRIPVDRDDEISQVGEAMNHMARSIEEILSRLQRAGVQLTISTRQISAAAKEQESTIVQQETATKQIAVTAKEISATASEFASYIQEVTKGAEETSSMAASGKDGLSKLKTIMKQMVDASTSIAEKLSTLNEKTGVITGVITTITKVADRTNLLSLNAAIEAHKLGEKGGSFGVIAKEIRRLADQTAFATLDIEKVVHEMVTAVSSSVEGVGQFSEDIREGVKEANSISILLTKIIAQVQQQTSSFESVNQGMNAQSAGARQITDSIEELSEAAQQSTASIRQFHSSLSELTNAIKELQNTVGRIHQEPEPPAPSPNRLVSGAAVAPAA